MSTEENKALVRRILDEVWGQGHLHLLDEHLAPNFVDHGIRPPVPPGPEGYKQFVTLYRNAFPDWHAAVEDQIAEGDKVVTRWHGRGTHQGDFLGIPATGKQVAVTGITINRIADGKGQEGWTELDALGIMQQLGVVPAPGQTQS